MEPWKLINNFTWCAHIELGQRDTIFIYSWWCVDFFLGVFVSFSLCCPCPCSQRFATHNSIINFFDSNIWREKNEKNEQRKQRSGKKLLPKSLVSVFDGVMVFVGSPAAFLGVRLLAFVSRICNGIRTDRSGVWSFIKLAISNSVCIANSFVRLVRPYLKNDHHLNSHNHNTEHTFLRAH